MRARGLFLLPALLLPAAGVFLVRPDHLSALASVLPSSVIAPSTKIPAPPAPPPGTATPPPPAQTAAPIASITPAISAETMSVEPAAPPGVDPATLVTLPPSLIDDGSDDVPDPEPKDPEPAVPKRDRPVLASTARDMGVRGASLVEPQARVYARGRDRGAPREAL